MYNCKYPGMEFSVGMGGVPSPFCCWQSDIREIIGIENTGIGFTFPSLYTITL